MSSDPRLQAVEHSCDFHPISARQIFDAAAARGIGRERITEDLLQLHDQVHYGGTAAVDRLIATAAVRATIPVERQAMFRSLQAQTLARLGQAHFERDDRAHEHLVGLYRSGLLGGALFHARRA